MIKKLLVFAKKDMVLTCAGICAIFSCLFVPPSLNYIDYINFAVLCQLFCFMAIVCGFQKCGVLDYFSSIVISFSKNNRHTAFLMVCLCFFGAMLITNDVALMTFVPFSIVLFKSFKPKYVAYIVTLETIAANLGSMTTPIGNPQNLFLFSYFNIPVKTFFGWMFPYAILSLVLLLLCCFLIPSDRITYTKTSEKKDIQTSKQTISIYFALFILCIMSVFHFISYIIVFFIVIICIFFTDKKIFLQIDYALLLTFVMFFVFSGNISNIPVASSFLGSIIKQYEFILSLGCSQIISNVPAALLLAPFSNNHYSLLVGVNVGGLGTLVASLASLISYKKYTREYSGANSMQYLAIFTSLNIVFLVILSIFFMTLKALL